MAEAATTAKRPSTFQSLSQSLRSWRTACVVLQSFSSGLPLGLVLVAVPAWLKLQGFDNSTIGWVTAAQLPYAFKFLWSPLMDRYAPPFLGRKRGWAVITQAALLVTTLGLAWVAAGPEHVGTIWMAVFLIAFASASQDIAVDAYAVEVLRPEEQGLAAGARAASSRFAMTLSGRLSITAATWLSWPFLFAAQAVVYPAAMVLMWFSPEPESPPAPPRTLRAAVWEPFVAFLRQYRAIEITSFLVLYKFGDNLATALVSPFLLEMGYSKMDVGLIFFWIGFGGAIVGTILGGAITSAIGLGHALWLFGFVQAFAHAGYVLIAHVGINRPLMYATMFFETVVIGMGTGAFSVLLLRLTSKKFSATQYALLSSIFALGRTASGPLAGVMVDALGWPLFFWLTIVAAAPGLVMLQRFVPIGTREPIFKEETGTVGVPLPPAAVAMRALLGAVIGTVFGGLYAASLEAMRAMRATPPQPFSLVEPLRRLIAPDNLGDWTTLASVVLFGLICGTAVAALAVARRGIARS